MTWIKVLDDFPEHQKTIEAGEQAAWLFVCGLAYCSRNLTDGLIPKVVVPRLTGMKSPLKLADRLVVAGLWGVTETGFEVINYLKHQTSAETAKKHRKAASVRKAKERAERLERERIAAGHMESHSVTSVVTSVGQDRDTALPPRAHAPAGACAPSGSGSTSSSKAVVEIHARAGEPLADHLNDVVRVLRTAPRLTFDPDCIGVANVLAAFPKHDHVQAAHIVVARAADPSWRTVDAARSMEYVLRGVKLVEVDAKAEKRARGERDLAAMRRVMGQESA